jgi:shikimate dehydrogenase
MQFMRKKKINEDQLEQIISQVKDNKIKGINVTVPFKKTIIPYLDELSTEAQGHTISKYYLLKKIIKIIGHNTDIFGFETSIEKN